MNANVIVYISPGCPDCAAVKHYLRERGIPFEERDITAPGVADEAKSRYGVRVAPITVIGASFFYGTFAQQRPQLDRALAGR
ncbi:glutaredoxin family protein [Thiobacillus sp.]|jgi:glutaredoxin|uniref:glutaredoxin family protein n=1 Tax=Thiobacillus sp. TaxID=924 RepID=UPI0025E122BA|nr:glutaredoxin family protein [Thiobacillus sp.]